MADKLLGCTEPRIWTEPLRPLNRHTSNGFECIEFNRRAGQPLLPWQEFAAVHALELLPDGRYRFRVVLVIVARQNGKSTLKRGVTVYRMFLDGARLVVGLAQELSTANEQLDLTLEGIRETPGLARDIESVRRVNGQTAFRLRNGARYLTKASNRKAGRGLADVAEVNFDELREQQSWESWAAVSKTTTANPRGQVWGMSNAGDARSVVLNGLRDAAISGRDPSIGIFEWSAEDGCELDDPRAWAQANPSLGYAWGPEVITTSLATDPPALFRTEVLCQRVDSLADVIDAAAWRAQADPATGVLSQVDRGRLAVCYEISDDGKHATLVGATALDDGRVRTAVIRAWTDTAKARREIRGILDDLQAGAVAWFPNGPTAAHAPELDGIPGLTPLRGAAQNAACQGLVDLNRGRRLIHPGDPLQTAHIAGVRKRVNPDGGFRFERPEAGDAHVDAATATAGAVHAALTMPEPTRPRIRMLG